MQELVFHFNSKVIMKKLKIYLTSSIAAICLSCNTLDVPPMDIIGDATLFSTENGVTAYMMRLYADLPLYDFASTPANQTRPIYIHSYTGEVVENALNANSAGGGTFPCWDWSGIHNQSYFLEEFPKYASPYPEVKVNSWLGEAYWMRAYHYFEMVKRYGGIPIVDKVLRYPEQSVEELKLPRSKEAECYDFILSELDKAIELLPEKSEMNAGLALGRVNRYVAYALKARVALYAGSIARYGDLQLDGLVGVPANRASEYFNIAWTAAKAVEAGGYELYRDKWGADYDSKVENFTQIFLDQNSKESIWAKYYVYPTLSNSWDGNQLPAQFGAGYSGKYSPTLDFVEMYDDTDGNPFILETGTDAAPKYYTSPIELFAKAEPRLRAQVIFPMDEYKNEIIDVRYGIVPKGGTLSSPLLSADLSATYSADGKEMTIIGQSGMGHASHTYTGFYTRKWNDPTLSREDISVRGTHTPWLEFRYAEMLLTRAEAGVELNALGDASKLSDAVECMRQIRERAGAARVYTSSDLSGANGINLVRKERRMEMFFENKTFWDLKRWRIFHTEINSRQWGVIRPIYVWDQDKYYVQKAKHAGTATFNTQSYYLAIPNYAIILNDRLLPNNPGY
jgi:hypothetical protein